MSVEIVTPGQRLGHAQDYTGGPGTYVRGDFLYASVVGVKRVWVKTDKKVQSVRRRSECLTWIVERT